MLQSMGSQRVSNELATEQQIAEQQQSVTWASQEAQW